MKTSAAVIAAALLLGALGAAPAQASVGSVPLEVADFAAAPDGLLASLADFYGPGADGSGIDFGDSTAIGAVDRVFTFSPGWLAGQQDADPVALANQWVVPVAVGGAPLGVAIIWINPGTVRPQLADFVADAGFASALPDTPADAWVVSDEPRGAWFALTPPTLTALVAGSSGVHPDAPLAAYQATVTTPDQQPAADPGPNFGSALSIATIVGGALVVVLAVLLPVVWRRRRAGGEPEADEG